MDETGYTWAKKIQLHYIDGKYAHRLVNTGEMDMKVRACWSTLAGYDYQIIEIENLDIVFLKQIKELNLLKDR